MPHAEWFDTVEHVGKANISHLQIIKGLDWTAVTALESSRLWAEEVRDTTAWLCYWLPAVPPIWDHTYFCKHADELRAYPKTFRAIDERLKDCTTESLDTLYALVEQERLRYIRYLDDELARWEALNGQPGLRQEKVSITPENGEDAENFLGLSIDHANQTARRDGIEKPVSFVGKPEQWEVIRKLINHKERGVSCEQLKTIDNYRNPGAWRTLKTASTTQSLRWKFTFAQGNGPWTQSILEGPTRTNVTLFSS